VSVNLSVSCTAPVLATSATASCNALVQGTS
jgi:hypothetical protein